MEGDVSRRVLLGIAAELQLRNWLRSMEVMDGGYQTWERQDAHLVIVLVVSLPWWVVVWKHVEDK